LKKFFFSIIFIINCSSLHAADINLSGVGISLFSSGVKYNFEQYGVFGTEMLPWKYELSPQLMLGIKLNGWAGLINVEDEKSFFFSFGPSADLVLSEKYFLIAGISPTLLTKHDLKDIHLGGPLQFTIYAESDINFFSNLVAGFRCQHTSNANIYKENHGFNTYMLLFSYCLDKPFQS